MTLQQWCAKYPAYVGSHPNGAHYVFMTHVNSDHQSWELFHLNDYVVSSCTGGAYWLTPRV